MADKVLVTGGAGYVGSHVCKALAQEGFEPVIIDDLRRGNHWAVKWGRLIEAPLEDRNVLRAALRDNSVTAVMHFAAYAYVAESMTDPSSYFRNNVAISLNLLDAMVEVGVDKLVISSSCATYGIPEGIPIVEDTPQIPINPYGASKLMLEQIAGWYEKIHGIRNVSLRYFNAAGADPDGEVGEFHNPEPHLIPIAIEAALDRQKEVRIYGTDFSTPDGTAVRDYVHVTDLAIAHVAALKYLLAGNPGVALNLGTGKGISVREIVSAVATEVGSEPTWIEGERRHGDPPALVADPDRAFRVLGWKPRRSDLTTIIRDAVRWQRDILPEMIRHDPASALHEDGPFRRSNIAGSFG